jgi:O-antigen ligase
MGKSQFQRLSLFFYFASVAFENLDPFNTSGSFSISKLAGIIYFVSIVPSVKFFFKPRLIIFNQIWSLLAFFVVLTIISVFNINEISMKIIDIAFLLNLIISFVIIAHIIKDEMVLDKALYFFSLSCIFMSLLAFFGIGVEINSIGRVSFFGSNENEISIKLSAAILILLSFILNKNPIAKNKLLLVFSIPLLLYSMVLTGSRSGVVVLFLGSLILFTLRLVKQKNKFYGLITFVFSIAVSLIFFIIFVSQSESMGSRLLSFINDNDLGGRGLLWALFYNIITENYIFGLGYSGYIYELTKTYSAVPSPHNVFLEVILYSGIFGLLFFLKFIYNLCKLSFRLFKNNYSTPIILFPVILVYLLANQALSVKFFWIISSYIIATHIKSNISKNNKLL